MIARRQLLFVLVCILPVMGASYRTTNFVVSAATPQIAQQVGQMAERYRKEKALEWLGYEMPTWGQPCPLIVKVTMGGPGGATSFVFDQGQILRQNMEIEGPLDRILASVLPHEITHTVFAYHFRQPVPRWADEGGSVLSEDEPEKERHDKLVRQILNQNRQIPLRRLFGLKEYPAQVMCLYAEGYSMANFLVSASDRKTYLKFVGDGMRSGWDNAVRAHYKYNSVEELEQAWLAELRRTRRQPADLIARNANTKTTPTLTSGRIIVRLTAPPVQPLEESPRQPIYRGQSPSADQGSERLGDTSRRPEYLPEYLPTSNPRLPAQPRPVSPSGWQPTENETNHKPIQVQLGTPQFGTAPTQPRKALPNNVSPVGYPR